MAHLIFEPEATWAGTDDNVRPYSPQFKFPVHQGILDYNGTNTVAVALWAMEAAPITPTLELTVDTILQGGVGPIISDNPPWSPKGREV